MLIVSYPWSFLFEIKTMPSVAGPLCIVAQRVRTGSIGALFGSLVGFAGRCIVATTTHHERDFGCFDMVRKIQLQVVMPLSTNDVLYSAVGRSMSRDCAKPPLSPAPSIFISWWERHLGNGVCLGQRPHESPRHPESSTISSSGNLLDGPWKNANRVPAVQV